MVPNKLPRLSGSLKSKKQDSHKKLQNSLSLEELYEQDYVPFYLRQERPEYAQSTAILKPLSP